MTCPSAQVPDDSYLAKQLTTIKELVVQGQYHYSRKVQSYLEDGYYERGDMVLCILTATSVHKAERDEQSTAVDGYKYTVLGRDTHRQRFYTCGKIILDQADQRLYFFITAHEAD